ncbi:Pentatricopeptide repeat-containing protein [Rhynchospora pubera]|nr:Pentatricopeptide repeat-containing protein [Rhynchospora pubera]
MDLRSSHSFGLYGRDGFYQPDTTPSRVSARQVRQTLHSQTFVLPRTVEHTLIPPRKTQMPSPSPHRILPQLISALIQRHFSLNPTLLPSPHFPGFSSSLLQSLLASLPRFFPSAPLPSLALSFFSWAQSHCHFSHDEMTCREMARLLAKSTSLPSLWLFLRKNQALVTTATVTALIAALGEVGLPKPALNLFYRMKQFHCMPDVQCYNTLILVLCQNRNFKKARFLLDQMELPGARCKPSLYTYTIFITFYCKRGLETGCKKAIRRRIWEANHMFRRMVFNGFVPDVVTYNCLINGLCKTYRIGRAHELFDEMIVKGVLPNRITYNSFIRYYSVVNEADKAVKFMREMEEREHGKPSSSTYTPIIHSLCESGRVNEARDLLVEMVQRGHVPREFTYKLVCDALRGKEGENLSEEICRKIETGIRERIKQVIRVRPVEFKS